ncbi:MAG: HNH endonuclease [Candidatus Thermoplasmatota archaeon]|nr:HNH endonuclease [Candidatus Thermoplasmatota archaeon]|tara:strand:+ start:93 stop:2312 length:2220 start_codon:yes stop_codon:yes gene_type:complete
MEYIDAKTERDERTSWTKSERERWELKRPFCPICKQNYTKNNPMTKEHIQPLFLGGFERGHNIDAICKSCNTARNNVMIDVFATTDLSAIRRRMPAMKPAIESLVVWYIASLSGDREALAETDAYTDSFLKHRKISNPFEDLGNQAKQADQSAWSRLKNWTKSKLGKRRDETKQKIPTSRVPNRSLPKQIENDKTPSMTMDEFNKLVVSLIGSDEIGPGELGQRIIKYQSGNGWSSVGREAMMIALGVGRHTKYLHLIRKNFSSDISITGEGKDSIYALIDKSQYSVENDETPTMTMDEFKELVLNLIGNNSIRSSELGQRIIQYQKENGWAETGIAAMNKALGKPSTQTYKKTIGQVLSNEVTYEGLSGGAKLSLTQAGLSLINSGDSQTGINETMDPQKLESNPNENDETPTMTMDEFKELVLKLVGRNTVRLSELGQRIIQYQKENEWIQTGKSATNKALGLPAAQPYRKTIQDHFEDEVALEGEASMAKLSLTSIGLSLINIDDSITRNDETNEILNSTAEPSRNKKKDSASTSELGEMMKELIGNNVVEMALLGQLVIEYQERNGWEATGKEAFNLHFGFGKTRPYNKTIADHLNDQYEIFGEYNQYVRIKKFPQVNKFNTGGGSGLRFPVEPRDFAEILVLNQSLPEELDRNERTAIVIKKVNLAKTRVNAVFNRMYAQRRTLNLAALETILVFRENLGSKGVNQQPYSDVEARIVAEYFASAEFYVRLLLQG